MNDARNNMNVVNAYLILKKYVFENENCDKSIIEAKELLQKVFRSN
jgi:hypothetical protein